jgi:putative transposase
VRQRSDNRQPSLPTLDPTGKGRKRWTNRWKAALNAFDITFDGRLSAGRK